MKLNFYLFTLFLMFVGSLSGLKANNILISNISLTGQNTTDDYVMVQFDLSWENSWRTSSAPNNWDAAWVFVKYRVGSGPWQHAWLNDAGHSGGTGTGATISAGLQTPGSAFNANTNPGIGAFIYRSADGTGTFSITGAQLRWNYGANSVADNTTVDVRVFAIEMVYVPEGAFYVGSGGTENSSFTQANNTSGATVPFQITSTAPIIQGNNTSSSSSNLGARGQMDLTGTTTASLASGFPTGYAAFYMMKYEITQQQYVDFLNTLISTHADNRYSTTNTGNRYSITVSGGVYSTTNPYVACNYLSWMDGAAYMDWSGLRPMTELEFEKTCRGTATPVANEYAWGNTTATAANNITNPGATNETTSTSGANAVYDLQTNVVGPMRVGVFAKSATTRAQSGASYYGIMELSGNLGERPVTLGNATGRAFTGVHGDGALSANGHANETAWPGLNSGEVTGATGSGFRGGNWINNATIMSVSDRNLAANASTSRGSDFGFRGVRSQPFVCGSHTVTDIDGNAYNTVLIGTQCWMKENLKVTKNPAGTAITRVCPDNNATRCEEYGGLYTYSVMMNGASPSASNPSGVQGICPSGWHIPSESEWLQLISSVGGSSGAAPKLRSSRKDPDPHPRWHSATVSTDDYGFSALPAGFRNDQNQNVNMGNWSMWWSTTDAPTPGTLIAPDISFPSSNFSTTNILPKTSTPAEWAVSVRCLKD